MIMATHGLEDPERATLPFVMAVGALASDMEVVIGLQGPGVELAVRGAGDGVALAGFPPLAKLMADYRELGGRLLACPLSVNTRHLDASTQFAENAEVIAAGRFLLELDTATHVLVY